MDLLLNQTSSLVTITYFFLSRTGPRYPAVEAMCFEVVTKALQRVINNMQLNNFWQINQNHHIP